MRNKISDFVTLFQIETSYITLSKYLKKKL